MYVSHSRHVRAAIAAAALITAGTAAGVVSPAVAGADTTYVAAPAVAAAPAAAAAPARFHEAGDLFKALQFPSLPGAGSGSADQAQPPQPAPQPAPAPAPPPPPPTSVTPDELGRIVPGMPPEKIAQYIAPLNDAMAHGGIDTPVRQAAFIAQLAVESDSFRTFEEYASGSEYEGRADLGNTQAGDGERFKGRGAIQVTGRHNYESVSQFTGVDFVANPELLEAPENAFNTAAWYWTSRNLNQVADSAGIVRVSELVNGGHHALERRVEDFQRGLAVLIHP
ncbi:glycoside hydrolase family 19 protein [Rhodococcus sp. NPDC127528]|uniref:glycoside hydrolase family 19 protein n=1 Tax=unclassified Rhodococcus (in: high G+C Gram-positive bacteria) TaxID=192944 RepID=UPI00363CEAE1